jgi:hypothetical protein
MSDVAALEAWHEKYESWRETALPRMAKGEAKQAFESYPWFSAPGDPFAKLAKPASESRFALLTTGGYSIDGEQEPVQPIPNLGGATPQVRTIPLDVDREKLVIHHPGYDHRFAEEDVNVNLPLDRLQELADGGEIGSIAPETQVLMGLVVDVAPLLRETIPALIERYRADAIDAVLLVPS